MCKVHWSNEDISCGGLTTMKNWIANRNCIGSNKLSGWKKNQVKNIASDCWYFFHFYKLASLFAIFASTFFYKHQKFTHFFAFREKRKKNAIFWWSRNSRLRKLQQVWSRQTSDASAPLVIPFLPRPPRPLPPPPQRPTLPTTSSSRLPHAYLSRKHAFSRIRKKKRVMDGRTDGRTYGRTDGRRHALTELLCRD